MTTLHEHGPSVGTAQHGQVEALAGFALRPVMALALACAVFLAAAVLFPTADAHAAISVTSTGSDLRTVHNSNSVYFDDIDCYTNSTQKSNRTVSNLASGFKVAYNMDKSYTDGDTHTNADLVCYTGSSSSVSGTLFKVKYANVGIDKDGKKLDLIVTCTRVSFYGSPWDPAGNGKPFFDLDTNRFGCFGAYGTALDADFVIEACYHSDGSLVNQKMDFYFRDLDVEDTRNSSWQSDYAESLAITGSEVTSCHIRTNSILRATNYGDGKKFSPYYATARTDDTNDQRSMLLAQSSNGRIHVTWFGSGSATTEVGAKFLGRKAPPPDLITKKPQTQTVHVGETVTFTVDVDIQYTGSTNAYTSAVFTDTLNSALDGDTVSVTVERGGSDTTSNWKDDSSGLKLKFSAKKTGNSDIGGVNQFTISATVKEDLDVSTLEEKDGMGCFTNNAKITVGNGTSSESLTSNTVYVLVPYWKVQVHKTGNYPIVTWDNPLYTLNGAKFAVYNSGGVKTGDDMTCANETRSSTSHAADTNIIKIYKAGTYTVKETLRPTGFAANSQTPTLVLDASNSTDQVPVNVVNFADNPLYVSPDMLTEKHDRDISDMDKDPEAGYENNLGLPSTYSEGDVVSFKGTTFHLKHFAQYATMPSGTVAEEADFVCGDDARCPFATARPPSNSTTWRYVVNGRNVMPLGSYTLNETWVPEGYHLNTDTFVFQVVDSNGTAKLNRLGTNWD